MLKLTQGLPLDTGAAYVYAKTSTGYSTATVLRDPELTTTGNFGIDAGFDRSCSRLAVAGNGVLYCTS